MRGKGSTSELKPFQISELLSDPQLSRLAQPLLVQAISTLLPTPDFAKNPNPAKPSVQDTCQAAMVSVSNMTSTNGR